MLFQESVTLAALLGTADPEIEILSQPMSASSTITSRRTSVSALNLVLILVCCCSLLLSKLKKNQQTVLLVTFFNSP